MNGVSIGQMLAFPEHLLRARYHAACHLISQRRTLRCGGQGACLRAQGQWAARRGEAQAGPAQACWRLRTQDGGRRALRGPSQGSASFVPPTWV